MSVETALLIHTLTPSVGFALLCLCLALFLYAIHYRRETLILMTSLVLTTTTVIAMKYGFAVPRPGDALIELSDYAFPSSHAALSAFLATFISWLVVRRSLPIYIKIILVSYTILAAAYIDASRLVLHVHTPFQIMIGALLGFSLTSLSISIIQKTYYRSLDQSEPSRL